MLPLMGQLHANYTFPGDGMVELTEEALRIHMESLVIDGHCDIADKILKKGLASRPGFSLNNPQPELDTDIPRLRKGGVDAQVWVAYVSPDYIQTGGGHKACLEQIDLIHKLVKTNPGSLELATSAADIERIASQGKIAPIIGVEGGHAIEHSLDNLREYRSRGALYMTLTHNGTHDWADASYDKAQHGGLNAFGEEVVLEMNRLGMLVDISHASDDTVKDALKISKAPVIASHSSARAICGTRRNLSDDLIRDIADKGGLVMINFFPLFIVPEGAAIEQNYIDKLNEYKELHPSPEAYNEAMTKWEKEQPPMPKCSVGDVVDHIEHVIETAGIDHVGLGSDYDGILYGPDQMPDVSGFPYITQVLLNRGYREPQLRKILGGNFMRVLTETERQASVSPEAGK